MGYAFCFFYFYFYSFVDVVGNALKKFLSFKMEFLYSEKFLRGGSLLYVNKKSSNETYFEI